MKTNRLQRILVTGGSGFIGTNLTRELRGRGHDVWTLDLKPSTDAQSFRCDVGEYRQLERVFERERFDLVYHAAAEYGRWNGEDFYENLWRTNVVGTKNVVNLQVKHKFRLVQFSSAEVYGDTAGRITEDLTDLRGIRLLNDYAVTKWANEQQILNAAERFGLESVRIRPVNAYGPHEHYSPYRGVVPIFIYRALKGEAYTVYRGHKRIFDYVDDPVATIANIADRFRPGAVYHLGGRPDWERTIEQISNLVLKATGRDDRLVKYEGRDDFTTKEKKIDSSRAEKELGHDPKVAPEEGIPRTVEWFKKEYGLLAPEPNARPARARV